MCIHEWFWRSQKERFIQGTIIVAKIRTNVNVVSGLCIFFRLKDHQRLWYYSHLKKVLEQVYKIYNESRFDDTKLGILYHWLKECTLIYDHNIVLYNALASFPDTHALKFTENPGFIGTKSEILYCHSNSLVQ